MPYNLNIPGQVSETELKAIEIVAKLVPANGQIVEIGSLFGRSSWTWATSVDPSASVHCIDPWERNAGVQPIEKQYGIIYGQEQFLKYLSDCPNVEAHAGYSPKDFLDWATPLDLYFEDSVHANPILHNNLNFWVPHLHKHGIACGHDYRPRFPEVVNEVKQLAEKLGREIIDVEFFWCLLPKTHPHPEFETIRQELLELGKSFSESTNQKIYPCKIEICKTTVEPEDSVDIQARFVNMTTAPISVSKDNKKIEVLIELIDTEINETIYSLPESLSPQELLHDIPINFIFSIAKKLLTHESTQLKLSINIRDLTGTKQLLAMYKPVFNL